MKAVKKGQMQAYENVLSEKKSSIYMDLNDGNCQVDLPRLLLHSCCGPCSTSVIERLIETYNITIFFFNPNIVNEEEYKKRREAQIKVIEEFSKKSTKGKIDFIEGCYHPKSFYKAIKGMENEPEGGKRCGECIFLRLDETASRASIYNFDTFATTLTVSPHKNYQMISKMGNMLSVKYKVGFLDEDFKKRDGFKQSIEISKKLNLYRQNFCGCEYSVWEK